RFVVQARFASRLALRSAIFGHRRAHWVWRHAGDIGHADLGAGADHADGPHDQPEAAFLRSEDVLDASADPGACRIAASDVRRHLAAARLFALELWLEAAPFEQG